MTDNDRGKTDSLRAPGKVGKAVAVDATLSVIYGSAEAPHRAFSIAYVSGLVVILVRWCVRRSL